MRKKLYLTFRILLIILVFITIYIVLDFHYTNLINKELARIKNLGEPLTLHDITPKEIPPQENAAYFYQLAIDDHFYNSFKKINFAQYNYDDDKPETLINSFKEHKDKISESLKENKTAFEMLKLGYEKPKCRYNLNYSASFKMKVLNFISCRGIAVAVSYKAVSLILENKPEKAVEILAQGFRFARSITMQNTLIEVMIKIAMENYLITPLEYMVKNNIKTNYKPVLNEIEAILKEQKTGVIKSIMTERVLGLNVYENPAEFYEILISHDDPTHIKILIKLNQFLRPLIKADELTWLKYYKQTIEDIRTIKDIGADRIFAITLPEIFLKKYHVIARILAPNFRRAFYNHEKTLQKFSKLKQNLEKL